MFEVITVNGLRVGEGGNSSTKTPVMMNFQTAASAASCSTVIQYYSLK
jgi:hypothetical protein